VEIPYGGVRSSPSVASGANTSPINESGRVLLPAYSTTVGRNPGQMRAEAGHRGGLEWKTATLFRTTDSRNLLLQRELRSRGDTQSLIGGPRCAQRERRVDDLLFRAHSAAARSPVVCAVQRTENPSRTGGPGEALLSIRCEAAFHTGHPR